MKHSGHRFPLQVAHGPCPSGQAWVWEWDTATASMTSGCRIGFTVARLRLVLSGKSFCSTACSSETFLCVCVCFHRTSNEGLKRRFSAAPITLLLVCFSGTNSLRCTHCVNQRAIPCICNKKGFWKNLCVFLCEHVRRMKCGFGAGR